MWQNHAGSQNNLRSICKGKYRVVRTIPAKYSLYLAGNQDSWNHTTKNVLPSGCWELWYRLTLAECSVAPDSSKKKQGDKPVLVYCCANIADCDPPLKQDWVNVFCLLPYHANQRELNWTTQCTGCRPTVLSVWWLCKSTVTRPMY